MAKDRKPRVAIATIYPISGDPYEREVKLNENDRIVHEGKEWVVVPGSVWRDAKGKRRVGLPENMPVTLSHQGLLNKTPLTARNYFLHMHANVLEQMFRLQNTKPWFKETSTWIIAGCLLAVGLVLCWMVIETSSGFDSLGDVLANLQLPAPPSPQPTSGVQPIAPGPRGG